MKNTRKGFTLVELVIVIAVIAILAAVLIPTFGGIIDKANESSAAQEARNAYAAYLAGFDYVNGEDWDADGDKDVVPCEDLYVKIGEKGYVAVVKGEPKQQTEGNYKGKYLVKEEPGTGKYVLEAGKVTKTE